MPEIEMSEAVSNWLGAEIERRAKECALTATMSLVCAVMILLALHWFFGDVILLVLLGTAISYGLFGGFKADRTVLHLPGSVAAQSSTAGSRMNPNYHSFLLNLLRWGLIIGAAPVHLLVWSVQEVLKRRRVLNCNLILLGGLIQRIINAGHAMKLEQLAEEMGLEESEEAQGSLRDIRGGLFLKDPERVVLTDSILAEISAAHAG